MPDPTVPVEGEEEPAVPLTEAEQLELDIANATNEVTFCVVSKL